MEATPPPTQPGRFDDLVGGVRMHGLTKRNVTADDAVPKPTPRANTGSPAGSNVAEFAERYRQAGEALIDRLRSAVEDAADASDNAGDAGVRNLGLGHEVLTQLTRDLRAMRMILNGVTSNFGEQLRAHQSAAGTEATNDKVANAAHRMTGLLADTEARGMDGGMAEDLTDDVETSQRKALLELDSRIVLPPARRVSELLPGTRYLLGTMRSPLALGPISKMIIGTTCQATTPPRMIPSTSPAEGSQDGLEDEWRRTVAICSNIDVNESKLTAILMLRCYWEVELFLEVEHVKKNWRRRSETHDVERIAKRCGWTKQKFFYHYSQGRTVLTMCGRHRGLCPFVVLESPNDFGIAARSTIQKLVIAEAKKLGQLMDDKWARSMCTLGSEVVETVIHGREPSENMKALTRSELDFATMSSTELQGLLEPWANTLCDCRDVNSS